MGRDSGQVMKRSESVNVCGSVKSSKLLSFTFKGIGDGKRRDGLVVDFGGDDRKGLGCLVLDEEAVGGLIPNSVNKSAPRLAR